MEQFSNALIYVPLLPLGGAVVNLLVGKRLRPRTAGMLASAVIAITALLSTQLVVWLALGPNTALTQTLFSADWLSSAQDLTRGLHVTAGLRLDALSAVLLMVITWIGFLIHVYAMGYMKGDPRVARFFAYLNLFMGAMLLLVLGDSLPMTFVGWEGVGLCSYLLIGFWYQDDKNATAGRKAFIVNRIGDFGFLLGMCLLFSLVGTLKYSALTPSLVKNVLWQPLWLNWPASYWVALLFFIGCTGKSAQIPLYVWLPDAMAGPTPVSALIHAATMVTAGVYVIARMHPLFEVVPATARMLIAGIGALTALFAATIGLVQRDFKKVLAYSTVSQLGFLFVGVGTGAYGAALFHLVTHAFFKAGLFLGAGSVMHALDGEGDITKMGGLRKKLPITHATFLVYCLAITGIFPFSGFFSKDSILLGAWDTVFPLVENAAIPVWVKTFVSHTYPRILWGALLLAALCTAIYMWRLYFLVFTGNFRGTPEQQAHLHESPPIMTVPLVALALGALGAGALGVPAVFFPEHTPWAEWLTHWLEPVVRTLAHTETTHKTEWLLMGVALAVSLFGINVAYVLYGGGFSKVSYTLARVFSPVHRLLLNKYYIDEFYQALFVRPLQASARFCSSIIDRWVVDGGLTRAGTAFVHGCARALRHFQNGSLHRYVTVMVLGTVGVWYAGSFQLLHRWQLRRAADVRLEQQNQTVRMHFPASSAGSVFYRVDWEGAGAVWEAMPLSKGPAQAIHTYSNPGTYHVVVEACDAPQDGLCARSDALWFPHPHMLVIPNPEAKRP